MRYLVFCLLILSSSAAYAADAVVHRVKITTATASVADVRVIEHSFGRILDTASATVAAEIPARVLQVAVDVGDRVRRGDLLARLDMKDMKLAVASANASVNSLKSEVESQGKLLQRYQALAREKFVSKTVLEQAETRQIALQKQLQSAEAKLEQAKHNMRRSRIVAPYSGRVQRRFVAAGDYIGVGKPMFTLVRSGALTVELQLPETVASAVRVGQEVRLYRLQGGSSVEAHINDLSPAINTRSNALAVRVNLDHPPAHWYPGSTVTADIVVAEHPQAVVVPESCVVLRPQGDVVYRVEGAHVQAVAVTIGVHQHGMVEITHGLKAGALVALLGAEFLTDHAAISVVQP